MQHCSWRKSTNPVAGAPVFSGSYQNASTHTQCQMSKRGGKTKVAWAGWTGQGDSSLAWVDTWWDTDILDTDEIVCSSSANKAMVLSAWAWFMLSIDNEMATAEHLSLLDLEAWIMGVSASNVAWTWWVEINFFKHTLHPWRKLISGQTRFFAGGKKMVDSRGAAYMDFTCILVGTSWLAGYVNINPRGWIYEGLEESVTHRVQWRVERVWERTSEQSKQKPTMQKTTNQSPSTCPDLESLSCLLKHKRKPCIFMIDASVFLIYGTW